jgi:hypothetical protein
MPRTVSTSYIALDRVEMLKLTSHALLDHSLGDTQGTDQGKAYFWESIEQHDPLQMYEADM